MPTATSGSRSTFPSTIDDFTEFVDDSCEEILAEDFNKIQDATLTLERHTLRTLQTGASGSVTAPVTGASRPRMLLKTYTITLSGGADRIKEVAVPALSSDERAFFAGTPFASGNSVHLGLRSLAGDSDKEKSYHAVLRSPVNPAADSPWTVVCARLKHETEAQVTKIGDGDYILSLMVVS